MAEHEQSDQTFSEQDLADKICNLRMEINSAYDELFEDKTITEIRLRKYKTDWQAYLPALIGQYPVLKENNLHTLYITCKQSWMIGNHEMSLRLFFNDTFGQQSEMLVKYEVSTSGIVSEIYEREGFCVTRSDKENGLLREALRLQMIKEFLGLAFLDQRQEKYGASPSAS